MITLLASLAGFAGSFLPEVFKFYTDKKDKEFQLSLVKEQLKLREKGVDFDLQTNILKQENEEYKSIYSTYFTGITWIDALNGTVRPVLAYSFFFMYAGLKYLQFKLIENSTDITKFLDILWSIEDQSIFAGIISFYFGQRAIARMRSK